VLVIELDGTRDYVILFCVAAALGAIGGVAYELTLGGRGRVELPRLMQRGRYYDLGVWANVILGAIAAPAALWIFPPEEKTTVSAAGEAVTTTEWNIVKVVGLSLIIGSAASSFLTAMQARALALVKTQEAQQTTKVATQQLQAVKDAVQADAPVEQVTAQVESAQKAVRSIADSGPGNPDFE
jgi:hypothetical protein